MKITAIINNYIHKNINRNAGDWDDIMSIPDIAETLTPDELESKNPLCDDFWNDFMQKSNANNKLNIII